MALTRQLRRHRSDNGLTLSQQQVLGEVSRAGVTTPAELATRMHVRVQSLTDGINDLEARGLVSRRPTSTTAAANSIEVTADGVALLECRPRRARPVARTRRCARHLTDLEFDLLMLVAPDPAQARRRR